ncbi:MAG: MFS transporter [Rhodospirillaceae bacterium]|nr:MFS transporter [Rhodospirillaceae bacterium]
MSRDNAVLPPPPALPVCCGGPLPEQQPGPSVTDRTAQTDDGDDTGGFSRTAVRVLVCGVAMLIVAMGLRQSFGIFQTPISMDLGTGRQVFGLAIAIQNLLWGVAQPITGAIADRYGPVRVLAGGGVVYVFGLGLATLASDPLGLNVTLGVLVGLALAGCTYVTVLGAVGRVVSADQRTTAFGICTAAGSFGMFAVVPGAQGLLDALDWQGAFLVMAVGASLLIPLAFGLHAKETDRTGPAAGPTTASAQSMEHAVREARSHRGYWMLNFGFFVCGFHVAFVATHLPAYLTDSGMSPAINAWALALIGLFNIFGSYLAGRLGRIHREKYLLSLLYLARGVLITGFLVLPLTPLTALAFGAGIGFLWLGTVPLTSGLVARVFGVKYLSMLYGFTFMFHQFGAFLGAWGGGYAYDVLGSYEAVWLASIALALFAALVHLPIDDTAPVRGPRATGVAEAKEAGT